MRKFYSLLVLLIGSIYASAQCPTEHEIIQAGTHTFIEFDQVPCTSDSIYIDTVGVGNYVLGGRKSGIQYKFVAITGNPTLYSIKFGDCGIICTYGQALPVELTSFHARLVNEQVVLKWVLASQSNLSHINVIRDNKIIEVIDNNDETQTNWTFNDESPIDGVNYYSLEFVDFDGEIDYSPLEAVLYRAKGKVVLIGSNVGINFVFNSTMNDFDYKISVFTISGELLVNDTWNENNSKFELQFSSPGMYVISIYNQIEKNTFKVVVP